MTIEKIRENILIALNSHSHEKLLTVLDDTSPGHYGVEDVDFEIDAKDIQVDRTNHTFSFKAGQLSFMARLGSSNEEDGADMKFSKSVSGYGKFEPRGDSELDVIEFSINEQLDLFDNDRPESYSEPSETSLKSVVAALEDARYQWRTVKGIAKQTGISRSEVLGAIRKLIDIEIVIRSSVLSARGEDLYTTREHFKRFTPLSKRLSAAFRNRPE